MLSKKQEYQVQVLKNHMSRKSLKKCLIFDAVIKDIKRVILLKIPPKNSFSLKKYVSVFNEEAFLPPLDFKRFSTILHYSVMTQMILAFINTFQILNINLLMNFEF